MLVPRGPWGQDHVVIFILLDHLFGNRMDDAKAVFLYVNDQAGALQTGGNFEDLKRHNVMHGLDGDITG